MKKSARSYLTEALRQQFIPVLQEKGWKQVARLPEYDSPELRRAFCMGLIQKSTEEGIESVDIQFDKYGVASFRVIIGTVPYKNLVFDYPDGSTTWPPEQCHASDAPNSHSLNSYKYYWSWFSFWPWQKPSKESAEAVIGRLIKRWEEAEAFFKDGRVGPHLTFWPAGKDDVRSQWKDISSDE